MKRIIAVFFCAFVVVSAYAEQATCEQRHCIAIVDAGSTGSRLHVYAYDLDDKNNPAQINEIFSKKIKPGLATLEPSAEVVNTYLNNLFNNVAEQDIPVYFYSTAGMRLLPFPKQQVFYQMIKQWFSTHAQWRLVDSKTITGNEEGIYGWLAVNYQLGRLGKGKDESLVSVMDMGGASVQVTFPVQNADGIDPQDMVSLDVNGRHFQLFVKSFLGLGQTLLSEQFLDEPSCFADGYTLPSGKAAKGDAISCQHEVSKLINQVHGVDQIMKQAIASNPSQSWYALGGVSITAQTQPFSFENNQFTSQGILDQADSKVCHQAWQDLNGQYPNHEFIYSYCLLPAYYYSLVVDGYGLQPEQPIHFFKASAQGADWSLGVVLQQHLPAI